MAEKFILEFYEGVDEAPIATLLVFDHGENPEAVAITLGSFLSAAQHTPGATPFHAGDLVSRFVLWEADISGCTESSARLGTRFLRYAKSSPYQLARLRVDQGTAAIEIVTDEYTTEGDIADSSRVLSLLASAG